MPEPQAIQAPAQGAQAAGVIHDLGYRSYDGPRLGRAQIVRALIWHSFRSSWGIGRGIKAKIIPILAMIAMLLPAFVNAFAVARGNARLFGYDVYTPQLRVLVVIIFIAAQAPELVSRDLRSHVMPLYFSRPLRRDDYPLAKYIALTLALLVLIEVPLLILYVGTIASAPNPHFVWSETRALIPGLGVGLLWAVLMAAIGLVLASLTGRRAYATGIVAISCVLTFTVSLLLIGAEGGPDHHGHGRADRRAVQPVHHPGRRADLARRQIAGIRSAHPGRLRPGLRCRLRPPARGLPRGPGR